MKESKTTVISFHVPVDVVDKADMIARTLPYGSKSKVYRNVFMPAFEKAVKKHEKQAAEQNATNLDYLTEGFGVGV